MGNVDWRLPEYRRELFHRFYSFQLKYHGHPGMVYSMMPRLAEAFDLDEDQRAWLVWLNGNSQNIVSSMLLLEAAPHPQDWRKAIDFWNEHFKQLEWDIDRRHQKSAFGRATEQWFMDYGYRVADDWMKAGRDWEACWKHSLDQPYMGRISAWSMYEYARILLGPEWIPDVESWFLEADSSRSHRNSLCFLSGYDDAWGWDREKAEMPFLLGLLPQLEETAEDLLREAQERNPNDPNVTRLTMESALCTFKSWHKPNRRYPNVYADLMYNRIRKAETRFGRSLDLLWDMRKKDLPAHLRLEDNLRDPGLAPLKQNWYRETGEIHYLHYDWDDMEPSGLEREINEGLLPERKDPSWEIS